MTLVINWRGRWHLPPQVYLASSEEVFRVQTRLSVIGKDTESVKINVFLIYIKETTSTTSCSSINPFPQKRQHLSRVCVCDVLVVKYKPHLLKVEIFDQIWRSASLGKPGAANWNLLTLLTMASWTQNTHESDQKRKFKINLKYQCNHKLLENNV